MIPDLPQHHAALISFPWAEILTWVAGCVGIGWLWVAEFNERRKR